MAIEALELFLRRFIGDFPVRLRRGGSSQPIHLLADRSESGRNLGSNFADMRILPMPWGKPVHPHDVRRSELRDVCSADDFAWRASWCTSLRAQRAGEAYALGHVEMAFMAVSGVSRRKARCRGRFRLRGVSFASPGPTASSKSSHERAVKVLGGPSDNCATLNVRGSRKFPRLVETC